jgi:hypothetical protein
VCSRLSVVFAADEHLCLGTVGSSALTITGWHRMQHSQILSTAAMQSDLIRANVCCAGDALGNIALLDINGKELWERHVKSMITQVRPRSQGKTCVLVQRSTL